jgi:hypothetical protein
MRDFDLNVSTIKKGHFQMKLVYSANGIKKIGKQRRMLRDLSFHINTKNNVMNIASPALAYLDNNYNRCWGRPSIG